MYSSRGIFLSMISHLRLSFTVDVALLRNNVLCYVLQCNVMSLDSL